jgi:heptosyltransferase-2
MVDGPDNSERGTQNPEPREERGAQNSEPGTRNSEPRVLVAQPGFLGDVILSTPLIRAVRTHWPSAQIEVAVRPSAVPLLDGLSFIDRVFADRPPHGERQSLAASVARLRRRRYDLVITPSRSLRIGLQLRAAGIRRRVGYLSPTNGWFYTDLVRRPEGVHTVDREAALLAPLGIPLQDRTLSVATAVDLPIAVAEAVTTSLPLIAIAPGSVWATKRWTMEGFAAIAEAVERGCPLGMARALLVGSLSEAGVAEAIAQRAPGAINLCGATTLPELALLLSRCALLITNDSAPAHVAGAVGTPVVQIYGASVLSMGYGPLDPRSRIVQVDLPCRPCGAHHENRCPAGHFRCMRDITPEMVLGAAREVVRGLAVVA